LKELDALPDVDPVLPAAPEELGEDVEPELDGEDVDPADPELDGELLDGELEELEPVLDCPAASATLETAETAKAKTTALLRNFMRKASLR